MSAIATQPPDVTELYMIVKDAELIGRLMATKGISRRQLARSMGWTAHSYVNRILAGNVRSVSPDAAVKIAYLLGVPVDLIFVPRVSGETPKSVRRAS